MCDHRVDVSVNTMKYMNNPLDGCIGPRMSPCIFSMNFSGYVYILIGEGLMINFSVTHVVHMKSEIFGNFGFF
jgi:hypothetical protein